MDTALKRDKSNFGLSDQVRSLALKKYVQPAIKAGKTRVSIAARDLMKDLRPKGFPERNWHQICSAIQAEKFLRAGGLEIETVEGPPSKMSSTVVVHYRVAPPARSAGGEVANRSSEAARSEETPEEWAHRVTGKLRGLLKEELAAYGGGEAFLRWVRGYDEEEG